MPASMSSALPTPSPSANAASLTTWQTIRPSTSPGASPTHAVCLPSVAKNCSVARAAELALSGPRVSSTSRDSRRTAGARETRPPRRRDRARPASPAAQQIACGRALQRRLRAPRRAGSGRGSAAAASPSSASSGAATSQPAACAAARSSAASSDVARDHDEPVAAAGSGRLGVGADDARRRRSRSSRARTCARGARRRPSATVIGDGRQRGSPKLCS